MMLALCYNLYSIGFIVRVIFGRQAVACTNDDESESYIYTQNELGNPLCAFVFLFLYFFGMAANIWWVILTLTWFLAAGMKWSYEAIGSYTNLFHLVAWLLPVVKTVLVLIFRKVDGDELTGLCYVGNQDLLALTGFVLGPKFTYLIIGTLFLLAGFIALYRMRLAVHKERLHKIDKLDRFIMRIGIFSVLSTVPATCIIATHFYEYSHREDWLYGRSEPNTKVFMLKICMALFVGVMSGAWMWTSKTCTVWKSFYMKKIKKQTVVQNGSNNNMASRNLATTRTFQADTEV
jgi:frizzled protein 4